MSSLEILSDIENRIAQLETQEQTPYVIKKLKEYDKYLEAVQEGYSETYINNRLLEKTLSKYSLKVRS